MGKWRRIFQDQSKINPDLLKKCLEVGGKLFNDLKKIIAVI